MRGPRERPGSKGKVKAVIETKASSIIHRVFATILFSYSAPTNGTQTQKINPTHKTTYL